VRFLHHGLLDSTNAEAARLAAKGILGPLWISAERQSSGKGRRGRNWVSETGNIYCTGLYPHDSDLASAARLSFAAALAVADTLGHYIDPELVVIKWPNDILVDGKKIAGILLESGSYKHTVWIAIGIGINLSSYPQDSDYPATHVLAHIDPDKLDGPEPVFTGAKPVLALLAARFDHWRTVYLKSGFAPLREAWLNRAVGIGGPVTARLPNVTISGVAQGMDKDGALEIKTDDGKIVKIHAGDVFFS